MNGNIMEITEKLLSKTKKSYAKMVKKPPPNEIPIFYKNIDRCLSKSTAWRWIGWMAELMHWFISTKPEVSTETLNDAHQFSESQAKSLKRYENLYQARRLYLGNFLKLE